MTGAPPRANWADLGRELDAWRASGRRACIWWRDDDAGATTPSLDRLLGIAAAFEVPLALAAIPARLEPGAVRRIRQLRGAEILQHGYRHLNHEPAAGKKSELGPARRLADALVDLRAGRARLDAVGAGALAVLVPPWNRITPAVCASLNEAGLVGLSTYGPRGRTIEGLRQVNGHIDIVDWRGTRGFVGTGAALGLAVAHLRARRLGEADADEATGLLTHHAVHDDAAWHFIEAFLRATRDHRAAEWPPVASLFALADGRDDGA